MGLMTVWAALAVIAPTALVTLVVAVAATAATAGMAGLVRTAGCEPLAAGVTWAGMLVAAGALVLFVVWLAGAG
jgi:hypothetical protein